MCDTEHMFDCPDSNRESEIGALARSIQNEGAMDSTLDKIMDEMVRKYLRLFRYSLIVNVLYLKSNKLT